MKIILIIAIIAIIIIIWIIIKWRAIVTDSKKLKKSDSILRIVIFESLHQKFIPIYGDDSIFLAVAIVNEIINEEPTNSKALSYKNNNINLIRQKTMEIIAIPEYAEAISLLLFIQWSFLVGEPAKQLTARADELSLTIMPPIKMLEASKNNKSDLINMIYQYAIEFQKTTYPLTR